MRTSPVNDRGQSAWQHERERREKANVPFDVAFALRDLGERPNAARCETQERAFAMVSRIASRVSCLSVGLPSGRRRTP
jgi:hypothetical protein